MNPLKIGLTLLLINCCLAACNADAQPNSGAAPTATPRIISLHEPEKIRVEAESLRARLEEARGNGSINYEKYQQGIQEYKKRIEKYFEAIKVEKNGMKG